jgi:hypothetical protein
MGDLVRTSSNTKILNGEIENLKKKSFQPLQYNKNFICIHNKFNGAIDLFGE